MTLTRLTGMDTAGDIYDNHNRPDSDDGDTDDGLSRATSPLLPDRQSEGGHETSKPEEETVFLTGVPADLQLCPD